MKTADLHSLAGAYALHALDEPERIRFERHAAECASCATEIRELAGAAARLADDVWAVPPPGMRSQVLARIQATPQDPPRASPPARAPRLRRRTFMLAAGLVAIAGAGGVLVVRELLTDAEQDQIDAVLAAPDAFRRNSPVQGGGQVTLVASPSRDAAVVTFDAVAPSQDRSYQMWLVKGAEPVSAGVLPAGTGEATRLVTGLRGRDIFAVTIEAAGGASAPTTPIIASVPLT